MIKVLITGGLGFVGRNLYDYLSESGEFDVYVTSRRSEIVYKDSKMKDRILNIDFSKKFECDKVKDFDVVIHCAANPNPRPNPMKPNELIEDNIEVTHNIARSMKKGQYLIFMSSILVYDKYGNENPQNLYGVTKLASEKIANIYGKQNGFNVTNLRLSACVGHKYLSHGMFYDFIRKVQEPSDTFEVLGDAPGSYKPYIFVYDVAKCVIDCINSILPANIIDCFPEDSLFVQDVAEIVLKEFQSDKKIVFTGEDWSGDQKSLDLITNNDRIQTARNSSEAIKLACYGIMKEQHEKNK